jgi:hypothetical protein
VYSSDLRIPPDAFAAGLGDYSIVSTLCPGGKERMRRLMAVVQSGAVDLSPLVTHRFKLDDIEAAYELFAHQRDGVMKVAITLNKGLFRFDGGFSMNIDISATAAPHGWWCRWTIVACTSISCRSAGFVSGSGPYRRAASLADATERQPLARRPQRRSSALAAEFDPAQGKAGSTMNESWADVGGGCLGHRHAHRS